ncbi:hypothetical protein ACTFIR_009387 [Dictyostelium discoideum]
MRRLVYLFFIEFNCIKKFILDLESPNSSSHYLIVDKLTEIPDQIKNCIRAKQMVTGDIILSTWSSSSLYKSSSPSQSGDQKGEDELIQFEEGFYNTDLHNLKISNLESDDSSTSSSSSSFMFPQSIFLKASCLRTIGITYLNNKDTTEIGELCFYGKDNRVRCENYVHLLDQFLY